MCKEFLSVSFIFDLITILIALSGLFLGIINLKREKAKYAVRLELHPMLTTEVIYEGQKQRTRLIVKVVNTGLVSTTISGFGVWGMMDWGEKGSDTEIREYFGRDLIYKYIHDFSRLPVILEPNHAIYIYTDDNMYGGYFYPESLTRVYVITASDEEFYYQGPELDSVIKLLIEENNRTITNDLSHEESVEK